MTAAPALPDRARVVVVGGGVIGCSVAYHLAHAGWTDVLVLERDRLTCGTTWHAAGLMTCFGTSSETSTGIRLYSRDLYARLEAETGQATGFRPVGLVEVATDVDRLEEYRRVAAFQRHLGLEVHEISPREVAALVPPARTDDLLAGFHVPGDGRVNPVDLTRALAAGARRLGVRVVEGVAVTDVDGVPAVASVRTTAGEVECEYVVNCAGMWARELGGRHGVAIPAQAAEHYYLLTDTIPGLDPDTPVLEDPSSYGYFREEGGGMLVGLFEPTAAPWAVDGIPPGASFLTLPPDWDRVGPYLERAMARVPVTADAGVRALFCGPESFTPDLQPVVGEAPGRRGYFVAAGMNSVGVLSAGGIGRLLAHWITTGHPDVDVTAIGADRVHDHQLTPRYRAERTAEILGTVFASHTPGRQLRSARGVRRSPVHERLAAHGAWFRDVSGWESPEWYAGPGVTAQAEPSWGRQPWFAQWQAEHRAVREDVGLVDLSFMTKLHVSGCDAAKVLETVSAGPVVGSPHARRVDGDPAGDRAGWITYTQWLNGAGTIEADLTVTRLEGGELEGGDQFLVVASDTAHGHVREWLRRAVEGWPGQARDPRQPREDLEAREARGGRGGRRTQVHVEDVTSAYAMLAVQGPRSRELLSSLTSYDLSDQALPFRAVRWIDVGLARVLCARITYVGELGYELYVPTEMAAHVYDEVVRAGEPLGLRHVGLRALGSLRLEKGYRDYGHDVDNTDTVWEAGLGFAVALDRPHFVGRDACLAQRAAGPPRRRLVQVRLVDPEPLLHHAEVVLRDGREVGYVRAGSYGWTLGGAVGLAMVTADGPVTPEWIAEGAWAVDVAGVRWPARASLRPMYDPTGSKVRG